MVSVLVTVEKKYMMIRIGKRVAVIHAEGQSEEKEDNEVSIWDGNRTCRGYWK
jgi:hypothetical protein